MKYVVIVAIAVAGSMAAMDQKNISAPSSTPSSTPSSLRSSSLEKNLPHIPKQISSSVIVHQPEPNLYQHLTCIGWTSEKKPANHECYTGVPGSTHLNINCTECLTAVEMHLMGLLITLKPLWKLERVVEAEAKKSEMKYFLSDAAKLGSQMAHAQNIRLLLTLLAKESEEQAKK